MIANDLTLNPGTWGGTAGDLVFKNIGYPTPTSSLRRVQATALSEPHSVLISHQRVLRSGTYYNRHLMRIDRTLIDPLKGAIKGSWWVTGEVPEGTTVHTTAVHKDMLGRLPSLFLTAGVTDAILAGEV